MPLISNKKTYLEIGKGYFKIIQLLKGREVLSKTFNLNKLNKDDFARIIDGLTGTPNKINIIISTNMLFIKTLYLPDEAEENLSSIIKLQYLSQLPFKVEEVYFSYYVRHNKDRLIVPVFVIKKNYIDVITQVCDSLNINIKTVVPTPYLFLNLHQDTIDGPILYIDSMGRHISLTFIDTNRIYIRGTSNSEVNKEIVKTLNYVEEEFNPKVDPSFKLNGRTIIKEDLINLKYIDDTNESLWQKMDSLVKQVNNDFFSTKKEDKRHHKRWYFFGFLVLLIMLINVSGFFWEYNFKNEKLQKIKEKNKKLAPVINQLYETQEKVQQKEAELKTYMKGLDKNYSYLPWLEEISTTLGENIIIEEISFKEKELVLLSGRAPSATDVLERLKNSSLFTNIHFLGSIILKDDMEVFKIAGDLADEFKQTGN